MIKQAFATADTKTIQQTCVGENVEGQSQSNNNNSLKIYDSASGGLLNASNNCSLLEGKNKQQFQVKLT